MIVSLSWLKKYVDIPVDTKTLVHDLTMLGLNVEHVTTTEIDEPLIVIGRVIKAAPHPDADRLSVCQVDVGEAAAVEIVCGAPNVAAGQNVAVALIGARLPGGLKIRRSKIRGVTSNGMICSAVELGLGSESGGILVFDDGPAPGTLLREVLSGSDVTLEIEVTPNRPDQLCHVGVAREIAALYSLELRPPAVEASETSAPKAAFSVTIADKSDCYRFVGRAIRNVSVGESPAWLKSALESLGMKSINCIVDVTNYVMLEMGQPMHAYDLDRLPARKIGVRRAGKDERIAALDGNTYELDERNLLITDDDEPIGVAGVIGGMPTRVTLETRNLLLESAAFDAKTVRRSRGALNISTDASYRFERGSDRTVCRLAADRAVALICEIAGGTPGEWIDAYPALRTARRASVRRAAVKRLLGVSLGASEIGALLARLGFTAITTVDDTVTVDVPSWRDDIAEEVDLVEEVARVYGYERIGRGWSFRTTSYAEVDPFDHFVEQLSDRLCARGFVEVVTSSFVDARHTQAPSLGDGGRGDAVAIKNPLTSNHGVLRTSLLTGLADVIQHNAARGVRRAEVFTTGPVFFPAPDGNGLPNERPHLCLAAMRSGVIDFWNDSRKTADLFDIKAEVELLLSAARLDAADPLEYEFDAAGGQFAYHLRGEKLARGGILPAAMAEARDLDEAVWYAELDLGLLFEAQGDRPVYHPVAAFPESRRDLSLVAPGGVEWLRIEKSLAKHGGRLLESFHVFDLYRGDKLPSGSTAYGVRLRFRSKEGTLRDEEVDAVVSKIVDRLAGELNVVLRS